MIDGEVVVLREDGRSDFNALRGRRNALRGRRRNEAAVLLAFDLIECRPSVNEFNADCPALTPDHFTKFRFSRVRNAANLEPAWQNVGYFDDEFCAGLRQIVQAAFVRRQTVGRDPRRLVASPPNLAFETYALEPVHAPA